MQLTSHSPVSVLSSRVLSNASSIVEDLIRDGKGPILVSIAAGWFLSVGVRYMYPSLLPFFREEFNLGFTGAGFVLSLLWVAYALGQFPGGVLGDRIGEGNILVISTALSTGAVIVVALSAKEWMLYAGTVLFGVATALYGPTRYTIFTDIYSERTGSAVGFTHACGSVGKTVLSILSVSIASIWSWRAGYGILIPAFIAVTIALWLKVPSRTSSTQVASVGSISLLVRRTLTSISNPGILVVASIQFLLGFSSQGFLGFYPTYLIEIKGFSPSLAATVFGIYFALGILIQPLTGLVNDWIGPKITLGILAGQFSLGLFLLNFAETFLHVVLLTVLLSNRNGTGIVTNTFIADALPAESKGAGLGLLRSSWILLGATSPLLVGYLADLGLFKQAFLALSVLVGFAATMTLFLDGN